MGTILVWVDGSEGSLRALRWAADEVRLGSAQVRVVLAADRAQAGQPSAPGEQVSRVLLVRA
jgi:nucleotide-binding universal stress UspA family protein